MNEPKDSKKIELKPIKTITSKKEKKTKNLKLERLDNLDKSTVVNNAYGTCVQDMQGKALKIKLDILNNGKIFTCCENINGQSCQISKFLSFKYLISILQEFCRKPQKFQRKMF